MVDLKYVFIHVDNNCIYNFCLKETKNKNVRKNSASIGRVALLVCLSVCQQD